MQTIITLLIINLVSVSTFANTALPDPTRPATYVVENIEPIIFEETDVKQEITWKLYAVRISGRDKTAIINGKLVREGDDVGPAKVLEINPVSVIIDHDNQKLIVRLFKNQIIKDYKHRNDVKSDNHEN